VRRRRATREVSGRAWPSITWFAHESFSVRSARTGFFDKVDKESGVTKSLAADVITIFTSAPAFTKRRVNTADLYAAILPLTPNKIFLFCNIKDPAQIVCVRG
jgi:hypothetical protein